MSSSWPVSSMCPGLSCLSHPISYPLPVVYHTRCKRSELSVPQTGQARSHCGASVWRSRLTNLQPCGFFLSLGFHFQGCFLSSPYLSSLSLTPTPLYHSTLFHNIYHYLESSEIFLLPLFREDESTTKAETSSVLLTWWPQ